MNDTRQMRANTGNRIAFGVLILLVSLFVFICTCGAFGGVGEMVSSVFVGFFGLADYAYSLVGMAIAVAVIFNFRIKATPSKILKLSLMFVLGIWALNIYSSSGHMAGNGYGEYLLASYHGANTAGGMLYGIISYPLMRVITTVGALVVVCAAFFVMAFIALMPTIKKDVTYVAADATRREKPRRGSRMDRQKAPAITDFSSQEGGGSLYVVDVEGDPLSRSKRKNKGAEGYDPLYPNAGAHYEDELRSGERVQTRPDRFSSRSLARDILFSPSPEEDSFSNYRTMTNPGEALASPGAPYSAVRRNELRRRLGVDDTDAMARDIVRERYFGEEKKTGESSPSAASNVIDPDAKGASALGYSSFDALKADRTKQFGQMFGSDTKAAEEAAAKGGFVKPASYGAESTGDAVRREVPKPTRQMPKPAAGVPGAPKKEQSAANMAGLHGSVSRAITGEEKAAPPQPNAIPDVPAYEKAARPDQTKDAKFESAVDAAQRAVQNKPTDFARNTVSGAARENRVPRAFEGTAARKEDAEAAAPRTEERRDTTRTDRIFGGGYAPAERITKDEPAKTGGTESARTESGASESRASAAAERTAPAAAERKQPEKRAADNAFATSAGAAAAHPETQKRMEEAISRGVPAREDGGFKGDGPVIQQSLFAKQQMENIAKARREAPPLASYERIAEERSKRIYAPRDKSMQKAENLAKKMAKEGGGERMTQVNIDQAISQVTPRKPYIAPPMKLLIPPEPEISQNEDYEYKKQVICDTLRFFGVESEVVEIKVGPTFSLYTLHVEMPKGKSVSSLENYENDIAMKMEEESVRILAPIPGKNAVGIEVPNKKRRIVRLSEILQSPKFNQSASPATFGLGKDLYGQEYVCDIKELPHMLIAGATGAGKSCCINSLIISLLYKASPEEVRLIMVDPKRVELSVYAGIPHLMLDEIICDVDKAIRALNWAIAEMQRRIEYLSQLRYRDIDEYNQNCEKEGYEKMPRIVLIVDELADLMAQGKKAVEDAINRIARLARAVGIHLILATQRPSVDVVSGTIKNNLPSRVAFKVTSLPDSRTILDAGGAEKLLGNGDLFYMTPKIATPIRMQGAFISNSEVKSVVEFLKANNESYYDEKVKDAIFNEKSDEPAESPKGGGKNKEAQGGIPSEVFAAVRMGLEGNPITISGMQRRLGLGFPKAAKIFDLMRDMHLIEPTEDGKKHKVCITEEELEELENGGNADGENEE